MTTSQQPESAGALFQVVREISDLLHDTRDEAPLLEGLGTRLGATFRLDHCAIFLREKEKDEPVPTLKLAYPSADKHAVEESPQLAGLVDHLLTQSAGEVRMLTKLADIPFVTGNLQTIVFVPLDTPHENVGAIVLSDAAEKTLSAEETAALRVIGRQTGLTLHAAKLESILETVSRALAVQHKQMEQSATTDSLTGLHNRQSYSERLRHAVEKARAGDGQLSVLLIDTDHLKNLNDLYGTQAGDDALCRIADVVQGGIRGWDVAARYGGDEFCVMLPSTGGIGAVAVAERLRDQISAIPFGEKDNPLFMTVTIGVACLSSLVTTPETLILKADQCLREGKAFGGNQVMIDWDQALEGVSDE